MKKLIQLIFSQPGHTVKEVKEPESSKQPKYRQLALTPEAIPGRRFTRRGTAGGGPADE
jgi:hypothetical protein